MRHALLACTMLLPASGRAEGVFDFDHAPGRLPKTVVPDAYRIDITPDLKALAFTGTESIDLHVRAPTATFTLNQAGLAIASAALEDGSAAAVSLDQTAQTATLRFDHAVPAGRHTLRLAYSGPIPATPNGIYRDDYRTAAGAKARLLVTQFEVADARRMFPGWDEPAFKATFQLSVTLPRDLAVVSNMPVGTEAPAGPGLKHVAFATTPRMSTYLLALVAGDMAAIHARAGGADMAAWTPSGETGQAGYALDAEHALLPYYNAYFGVAYPLPKLDLIAIPGNYAAGAMENWGAITFIDDAMLFDPATSAPATRETIFLDVSHEMAHQWSGDLVTMGWWDDIWLNEGFATWMEVKATDHFNPGWEVWPRQHAAHEAAMALDAMPTTHPIQQVIHDETEADAAFDAISYEKGSQVIRMVEDWLGPDIFRDGMRRYMAAHAFGNATSADLWAALGTASGRDVAEVAAGFTEQPGIPLVHVTRVGGGDAPCELRLTRDRFTIHDPHPKALSWRIPVTIGAPDGAPRRLVLDAAVTMLPLAACNAPVKANWGETGYYRTQYDAASLAALGRVLPRLSPADRANLLGDQFALFLADRMPLSDYLDLLRQDADEHDAAVWTDTLSHLERLHTALEGSPLRPRLDAFAAGLVRPELARLGWDARPGEPFPDALLRPELIAALGRLGDRATVAEARRRFAAFIGNPASLAPALREAVLGIVGHDADRATYDALEAAGTAAPGTEEKLRYFLAMATASDPRLIARTVAFADAGEVPNGRVLSLLQAASQGTENPALVYRLVKPMESRIAARTPSSGFGTTPMVAAATGSSDPALARALLAEPSSQASTGAHIQAARVADRIEAAAELRGRVAEQLRRWLPAG